MKLKSNKKFLRNFILLFLIIVTVFSAFAIYTYHNSKKIIGEELTNSSIQNLESMTEYVDQFITDTKYMISTLVISDTVRFLLSSPASDFVAANYQRRVQEQLMTLEYSNKAIEAIYLYSEYTNQIYDCNQISIADSFRDPYWLDALCPDDNGISVFPYAMQNIYPYTICVAKEFDINGNRSVICFLLNLSKLPVLNKLGNDYQEFFIVSDDDNVIYHKNQAELKEPITEFEYLLNYDPAAMLKTAIYKNSTAPYSLSQLHSQEYSWSYVLYTPLQDYVSRLSSARAIAVSICFVFIILFAFMTIFFIMETLKPIRSLRKLLDNPELLHNSETVPSSDIEYIAGKITQYVQTNRQLATELDKRLNLLMDAQKQSLQLQINPHFLFNTLSMIYIQAVDSFGFEHPLPEIIQNLCTLLRFSLEPGYMVSLQTELHYSDIYLQILNERYERKLVIQKEIDINVLSAKVPRLFIQPIIENAVFHGFSKSREAECILSLRCKLEEIRLPDNSIKKLVILEVSDNGIGMDEETLVQLNNMLAEKNPSNSGKNIGLVNVMQRLNLLYADEASIEVRSAPLAGSSFIFTFPFIT